MERQGQVRVAVMEPLNYKPQPPDMPIALESNMRTVVLECLRIRWLNGEQKTIIVTQDDELALQLKPDWLPGQRAQVNSYKDTINNLILMLKKALKPDE